MLLGFGGHAMAAGFSIEEEKIPIFANRLNQKARELLEVVNNESQSLLIDAKLEWSEIDISLAEILEMIAPFGPGNPAPIFITRGLVCTKLSRFGRQKEHLQLQLEDERGVSRRVVWWGGGDYESWMESAGGKLDLAYVNSSEQLPRSNRSRDNIRGFACA